MTNNLLKVLFINSNKPDYLQDLTYKGLVKVLGLSNVVDYPWNIHFHIKRQVYPMNLGYVPGSVKSIFKTIALSPNKFDLVIVASAKPGCFKTYLQIIKKISSSTPVIFLDGGDFSDVGGDLIRLGGYDLFKNALAIRSFDKIFKREYVTNIQYPDNVYPFPFSFDFDRFDFSNIRLQLKYDVSFWAVESDPIRTKALEILEDKFDCKLNGTIRSQSFKKYQRKGEAYLNELKACKIILNFKGTGWDTMRYWESTGIGRFMISQRPKIVIPDNFRDGKEIVFCKDDLSDLIDLCKYYLQNEEERETIAMNALEMAKARHSYIHRAEYLLEKVFQ